MRGLRFRVRQGNAPDAFVAGSYFAALTFWRCISLRFILR